MPQWVLLATTEFAKRLQEFVTLHRVEIPLIKRGKSTDLARILEKEKLQIKNAIPLGARIIALDVEGEPFSSEALALKIKKFQQSAPHLCFIIGGPEGIAAELLALCHERWSLSKLTLPHTLARVLLLEAIYRAYTMLENHPYHRA